MLCTSTMLVGSVGSWDFSEYSLCAQPWESVFTASARIFGRYHAAFSSNRYSWCKPPRIGRTTTNALEADVAGLAAAPVTVRRLRDTWFQGHVWAACVVMWHPRVQETPQVVLGERDHEVHAFPPQRAQQPHTEGVRLRLRIGYQKSQGARSGEAREGPGRAKGSRTLQRQGAVERRASRVP